MRLLATVALAMLFAVPCMADNTYEDATTATFTYVEPVDGPMWVGARDVLYDNGPLVNFPLMGFGGADCSALQTTLLMNTLGAGFQIFYGYWLADDFTIPAGECWSLTNITFFGYQTGSPTAPSTFTAMHVVILDADPNDPAANVVFGDMTTNVMSSSAWMNAYRATDYDPEASNRPIMANICDVVAELGEGTYWILFQADGTGASGPWAPPITINGETTTGNAYQSTDGMGTIWDPLTDSGTFTPQGMPFIIEGYMGGTPADESTWGSLKALYR